MLLTLAAFVFVLGVLIFVHEAGHFLVAKAVGIQVTRFSLGFGKPLFSVQRGETEYVIAALPLGGYVKMAGLEDEGMQGDIEGGASPVPVDPARAFDKKPLPMRIAVILAGVTMNFLFAWAVFTGLAATLGSSRTATTQVDTVLVGHLPAGAEALGTLRRGDHLVTVNGDTVRSWDDVVAKLALGRMPLRVGVAGRAEPLVVQLARGEDSRLAVVGALVPSFPAVLESVQAGSPASRAGMQAGDHIVGADGDTIVAWTQLQRVIRAHPHRELKVTVVRSGAPLTLTLTPDARRDTTEGKTERDSVGFAGVSQVIPVTRSRFGPLAAVAEGWRQSLAAAALVTTTVRMLVTREASIRDLGGPIAIGKQSGEAARGGIGVLLEWMALLSVNLAVLNLLPIPILDGGQLVFLIAEGIRRKPLSLDLRLRLTQVGFVLILALMLFAIGNDALKYVFHR